MANKRPNPKENQIYKHFKGSLYQVITIAVHTETSDKLVVYRSIEKPERVFARPVSMFMSEVDHLKYPFIKAKYRFTLMVEAEETEEAVEEIEEVEESKEDTVDEEIAEADGVKEQEEGTEDIKDEPIDETTVAEDETVIEKNTVDDDTAEYKANGELVIDPIVETILDEKSFTKKIENFQLLRGKCTEEMLTTLAISLDIQLVEGTIEDKYAQILATLKMHEKYESARLRF